METVAPWVRDMRSIQGSILKIMREALREDFALAIALFGIKNLRIARKLTEMTVGEIEALAETADYKPLLRMDESLAVEMMMMGSEPTEICDRMMLRMAAAATSQPMVEA